MTLTVVVTFTVKSTLAMVPYPRVAAARHLLPELAALFIGAAIQDVSQVVGAGCTQGHESGDIATVAGPFRVAMLAWAP